VGKDSLETISSFSDLIFLCGQWTYLFVIVIQLVPVFSARHVDGGAVMIIDTAFIGGLRSEGSGDIHRHDAPELAGVSLPVLAAGFKRL
jgi:hypothetical protein